MYQRLEFSLSWVEHYNALLVICLMIYEYLLICIIWLKYVFNVRSPLSISTVSPTEEDFAFAWTPSWRQSRESWLPSCKYTRHQSKPYLQIHSLTIQWQRLLCQWFSIFDGTVMSDVMPSSPHLCILCFLLVLFWFIEKPEPQPDQLRSLPAQTAPTQLASNSSTPGIQKKLKWPLTLFEKECRCGMNETVCSIYPLFILMCTVVYLCYFLHFFYSFL